VRRRAWLSVEVEEGGPSGLGEGGVGIPFSKDGFM
jgi:hypothetical protein